MKFGPQLELFVRMTSPGLFVIFGTLAQLVHKGLQAAAREVRSGCLESVDREIELEANERAIC